MEQVVVGISQWGRRQKNHQLSTIAHLVHLEKLPKTTQKLKP